MHHYSIILVSSLCHFGSISELSWSGLRPATVTMAITFVLILFPALVERTAGQTDRTYKMDRTDMTVKTDRQTDRQTGKQTKTHTHTH